MVSDLILTMSSDNLLACVGGVYNEATNINAIADLMRAVIIDKTRQVALLEESLDKHTPLDAMYWSSLELVIGIEAAVQTYQDGVLIILHEYQLRNKPQRRTLSFHQECLKQEDQEKDAANLARQRLDLVHHFFKLVALLVTVTARCTSLTMNVCPECGTDDVSDVCNCGYIQPVKLSRNLALVSKGNYLDEENFAKMLDKHDGTISLNIKQMERIAEKLDKYFVSYSKPRGSVIRAMPRNMYGWKDGTSYKLMEEALRNIGETCYEYITSLCAFYWGYALPDIMEFKEGAIHDYELTQPIFLEIIQLFPKLRRSSPNTGFRKFKHLEARGYKGQIDEFRIVQTHDIKVLHNQFWKIMCECSGIVFIPCV